MNKKLLALAIGTAIALPATALAAGPTLFGQIDLSVESVDVDESTIAAFPSDLDSEVTGGSAWVLRNNASRIGVRGDVDTGVGNLKGLYWAEFGVAADDGGAGGSPFSDRNIFVGLQGDFGTVKLGNIDSPLKTSQGKVDQFIDSTFDLSHYVVGDNRVEDSIQYSSPKLGDAVTVNLAVSTDDNAGAGAGVGGDGVSASVVFEQDALYLALGYETGVRNQSGSDDLIDIYAGDEAEIMRLTAVYTVDGAEVGLLIQNAEWKPDSSWEDTSVVLSGAIKAGAWKFKGQYGQTEGKSSDEVFRSLAVGADYALGKSTTVYGLIGQDMLKVADDDRIVVGVGLRQKF